MKNIKFLLALLTSVVILASCATTQNSAYDDEDLDARTKQIGNRLYIDDPFYGRVVLERDPFTGRYYDVTYGYNRYSSPYYRGYTARPSGGYYKNYGGYRGGTVQQPPSREDVQKGKDEARKKILGN